MIWVTYFDWRLAVDIIIYQMFSDIYWWCDMVIRIDIRHEVMKVDMDVGALLMYVMKLECNVFVDECHSQTLFRFIFSYSDF